MGRSARIAAAGVGAHFRPAGTTLAELVAAHEAREAGPELEPLDEPAKETNALLRAELAGLRATTINRPDDGFGLGF